MATTKLYLDTRRQKQDGTSQLKIAINKDTDTSYINLHIALAPSEWDKRTQKIVNHPNRQFLNGFTARRQQEIEEVILNLQRAGELRHLTASQLRLRIEKELAPIEEDTPNRFAHHFQRFTAQHKGRTAEIYQATYNHLKKFVGAGLSGLTFDDVNKDFLTRFDNYLRATSPSKNARNIHLRNIRAVFNDAIDNDLTDRYPFRKFAIKAEETPHRALRPEELRTLFDYPCQEWQHQYVDIFKLIFFLCGINIVDLYHLCDIVDGRIEYHRAKTHKFYSIKVEPEALAIIEKYKGKKNLLNLADRCRNYRAYAMRLNASLQRIGKPAPLFPHITTYYARHSWATIAYNLGVSYDTIALALGHGGRGVTSIYIKPDLAKVDEANRRVMDFVLYDKK